MGRIWGGLALAMLAGCGDAGGDYPALMPTDRLLAEPALPAHALDAAQSPETVGSMLDGRARSLAGRAGTAAGTGDATLQRRAEALRDRAGALSQQLPPAAPADGDCPQGGADCSPN